MQQNFLTPIDRLRAAYGVDSDAALVRRLDTRPQTVSSWRSRARVPEAVALRAAMECGVSARWIMEGRGPQMRDASADAAAQVSGVADSAEDPASYQVNGAPEPEPEPDADADAAHDPRLAALLDWLAAWWEGASEEDRAWMVVEMRMLRGRLVSSR